MTEKLESTAGPWCSNALSDIVAERERQIAVEGWTLEHDDAHDCEELAQAAACYCLGTPEVSRGWGDTLGPLTQPGLGPDTYTGGVTARISIWPLGWARKWWKPTKRRRNLVKAAALIIAEIERIDRIEAGRAVLSDLGEGNAPLSDAGDAT